MANTHYWLCLLVPLDPHQLAPVVRQVQHAQHPRMMLPRLSASASFSVATLSNGFRCGSFAI